MRARRADEPCDLVIKLFIEVEEDYALYDHGAKADEAADSQDRQDGCIGSGAHTLAQSGQTAPVDDHERRRSKSDHQAVFSSGVVETNTRLLFDKSDQFISFDAQPRGNMYCT